MLFRYLFLFSVIVIFTVNSFGQTSKDTIKAVQSSVPVIIDGSGDDACWAASTWKPINQVWIPWNGTMASGDFSGKFKVAWDSQYLYLLIEVVDDMLSDDHVDPLQNWWDDDCVEIFVDENRSMGDHERNNNAFAYHINLKYDAIDLNASGSGVNYKNNVIVRMDTIATHTYLWEVAIKNYSASFSLTNPEASRVVLTPNKLMGLSVAYCDNDQTNGRENFIGSMIMTQATANDSYKNANYFGPVLLKDLTTDVEKEFKSTDQLVSVYPNPAMNIVNVERKDNQSKPLLIEIHSAAGSLVKSVNVIGSQEMIEIGDLLSGIYIMSIISDRNIQSERLIKR